METMIASAQWRLLGHPNPDNVLAVFSQPKLQSMMSTGVQNVTQSLKIWGRVTRNPTLVSDYESRARAHIGAGTHCNTTQKMMGEDTRRAVLQGQCSNTPFIPPWRTTMAAWGARSGLAQPPGLEDCIAIQLCWRNKTKCQRLPKTLPALSTHAYIHQRTQLQEKIQRHQWRWHMNST